jgi:hypothetical protein
VNDVSVPIRLIPEFQPPIKDTVYPIYAIFTTISCAILAAFIVFAVHRWIQHRDGVPAMFLAGGALASLFEPILDVNGGVWYTETGGIVPLTLLGIRMHLFIFTSYVWIIGGQAYLCWRAFDQRWPLPKFVRLIVFVELTDIVTELVGVGFGTYGYFGNQPFQVFGFPLWYSIVNTVGPLIAGASYYLGRPHLRGWHSPLGLLMVSIGLSASYCLCGWPLWIGLQQDAPLWVNYLLCIPTALFGYTTIRVILAATKVPGFGATEVRPSHEQVSGDGAATKLTSTQ